MGQFVIRLSRPLAFALSPLLMTQGRGVQTRMPKLPEAAGPQAGQVGSLDDPTAPRVRLLVIGESTAVGVGVSELAQSLTGHLIELLAAKGWSLDWRTIGKTGFTAEQAYQELLPQASGEYDLVLLLLGVNDVLAMTTTVRWRATVRAMVTALLNRTSSGGRLILAGVPRVDTFTVLPQPLRSVLGMHAAGLDRELVDLARIFPGVVHLPTTPVYDPQFLSTDGFHPSASGYAQWARNVATDGLAGWQPPSAQP